jgi:hypothetical protein
MTGPGLITGDELVPYGHDKMRGKELSRIPPLPPSVYTANAIASLADIGRIVFMNVAGANTFTIPNDATGKWLNDHTLVVCQEGAGATTIVAGADVTIQSPDGLVFAARYKFAWLYKRDANLWYALGGLTT